MIPLNPSQLPTQNEPVVAGAVLTSKTFYLLRALFNRTGGNSGIPFTVGSSLTATGTSQVTGLALANDFNSVTAGSGGVVLSTLQPGQFQVVFCGLGGGLNVYPFKSGQIDALGVNNPYSLANGKSQFFWCDSLISGASFYRSLQLG